MEENKTKNLIIAIDGYASSGKSTLAKDLAKDLGYRYIDTGAMYRGVAFFALQNNCFDKTNNINLTCLKQIINQINLSFETISGKSYLFLNGKNIEQHIRTMTIAEKASEISTIDFVRSFLVKQQQEMGKDKRLVMDGRDIGTVVFPNADIKFFIEASLEERTLRRYNELIHQNKKITIETVKKSLIERDLRDTTRAISPLKKAKDAILIDNTNLTRTEQLAIAKTIISEKFT